MKTITNDQYLIASIIAEHQSSFKTDSRIYQETKALAYTIAQGFKLNHPKFNAKKWLETALPRTEPHLG